MPPLAGFFSRDEILFHAYERPRTLWLIGLVTSLLTAIPCSGWYFWLSRAFACGFGHTGGRVALRPSA